MTKDLQGDALHNYVSLRWFKILSVFFLISVCSWHAVLSHYCKLLNSSSGEDTLQYSNVACKMLLTSSLAAMRLLNPFPFIKARKAWFGPLTPKPPPLQLRSNQVIDQWWLLLTLGRPLLLLKYQQKIEPNFHWPRPGRITGPCGREPSMENSPWWAPAFSPASRRKLEDTVRG